jgi:hypothetical protein
VVNAFGCRGQERGSKENSELQVRALVRYFRLLPVLDVTMTLKLRTTGSLNGTNKQTLDNKPHDSSNDVPETSPNDIFERTWAHSILSSQPYAYKVCIRNC